MYIASFFKILYYIVTELKLIIDNTYNMLMLYNVI